MAVGLVTHFGYRNPQLSPYDEFQRFKTHPQIAAVLKDGQRLGYGARAINEGGMQSLPRLGFPAASAAPPVCSMCYGSKASTRRCIPTPAGG